MSNITAFRPAGDVPTASSVVTATAATISPAYTNVQYSTYRFVNDGTATIFFLFGASPVVTAANGIAMRVGAETFSGPPNSTVQVIAAGTGSTVWVTPGEGL